MPVTRALSRAAAITLLRILRYGFIAAIIVFASFCALLLTVRFVVFPRVDAYRDTLTGALSKQVGKPVEIDALTTGWDGWNPKLVVHGLRILDNVAGSSVDGVVSSSVDQVSAPPPALLELPEVDLIVAWTSLPFLELRFKQLMIVRPHLALRRDEQGILHVAGMEIDPKRASDDYGLTNWMLHQPQILIQDAQIMWNDDLRAAEPLVLDHVQFRLESGFGRHRFGLHGMPPAELAGPIDLRGDLRHVNVKEWQRTEGRMYARLDYADIAAWREWLPLPVPIASGKGALRLWFDFNDGEVKEVVADLELADVKTQLADDLPELELDHLSGRAGWRAASPQRVIYARQLAFVTNAGQRLLPTDFSLTLRDAADGNVATGLLEFERLQLGPLRDVAVHLPLPEPIRMDLARYTPRGTLTHGRMLWEGPFESPTTFSASADFIDFGMAAHDKVPGARALTGHLEATQVGGRVKLASHNASFELPRLFAEPLTLANLQGDVSWERRPEHTTLRVERLDFANADGTGIASGHYRTAAQGPGEIELNLQLSRVDLPHLYRYVPVMVGDTLRAWLRSSVKGKTDDGRVRIAGNLADFPFVDGKSGQFAIMAKGRDLSLDYAKNWPPLTNADAEFHLDGARLSLDLARGRIADLPVGKSRVEIPDFRVAHPAVRIEGEAQVSTPEFLHVVNSSPVAGMIDHFTDNVKASGNGKLDLRLELPIGDPAGNRIAGDYLFIDNQLHLAGVPPLAKVNGKLAFTEHDMRAQDMALEVLGGPAKLAINTANGRVRVTGGGTSNIAAIKREYNAPLVDVLSGNLEWTIAADVSSQGSTWTLASSMKGTSVDLPAPVGKSAAETVPLKLERRAALAQPNEDTLTLDYGTIARVAVHRKLAPDSATIDRALLLVGPSTIKSIEAHADRPGLWLRGELSAVNADDWFLVQRGNKPGSSDSGGLTLAGADIDASVIDAFGRKFHDMKLVARRAQDDWRLELKSRELAGTATWIMPNPKAPNGRLLAKLARLTTPEPGAAPTWKGGQAETKPESGGGNPWPEINLESDSYLVRNRDLGHIQLVAHPRGTDWRIDKLALVNDAGRLDADGWWRVAGTREQTKLEFVLDVKDPGAYLARLGHTDAIKSAPAKINGQLEWAGSPSEFDYPTLGGSFHLDTGSGRFTKIEPGMGKLLGVLSLQALPRRIALDFTDVFSQGFAFDQIVGDVTLQNGVLKTSNMRLNGPAAKVVITGEADLAKETQQLVVRVQPSISGGVSAGAALFFLANPIVGAAVGAGSLLAQKVLRDPIEQMFSYEYHVSGTWSDPVVGKRAPVTAQAPVEPGK